MPRAAEPRQIWQCPTCGRTTTLYVYAKAVTCERTERGRKHKEATCVLLKGAPEPRSRKTLEPTSTVAGHSTGRRVVRRRRPPPGR